MEKIAQINRLTLKIFLLIVANDLADTAAQLLMKKGIPHLFDVSNPQALLFWIGLAVYISNFFLWMFILSKTDLSVALPLASASYILIPVAAVVFLHELVSPLRWLGLALIVAGIFLISKSKSAGDTP
jgi:drug/metabolite transporter (DMT)-like permease